LVGLELHRSRNSLLAFIGFDVSTAAQEAKPQKGMPIGI
jgi:hypothetical protein